MITNDFCVRQSNFEFIRKNQNNNEHDVKIEAIDLFTKPKCRRNQVSETKSKLEFFSGKSAKKKQMRKGFEG